MGVVFETQVPVPDGSLWVETRGEGRPVLLIAGLGGRRQFWREQAEPLSRSHRVVLHDHRGTGQSSPWDGPFSVLQMAEDVLGLMDALEIPCADLVGHSTGGAIVQQLMIDAPERVGQAVLSSTWAGPDEYFQQLFEVRRAVLEGLGPEAYLTDGTLRAVPPHWLAERAGWLQQSREERLSAFAGEVTELARIDAVMAHNLRGELPSVTRSVSIVVAEDDQITPPHMSEELRSLLSGSRLTTLPRGGHFAPLTEPISYNRFLLSTLGDNDNE